MPELSHNCPDTVDPSLVEDAVLACEIYHEAFVRLSALFRWMHSASSDDCLVSDLAALGERLSKDYQCSISYDKERFENAILPG